MSFDTFVHLFAGGLGGTLGAVATCPLEVVKTRLQSSMVHYSAAAATATATSVENVSPSVYQCLRHIVHTEGPWALFKGLGPNLIGVAPSRAIYFCTYSQVKSLCNTGGHMAPDTPYVHMISAAAAGFVSCTITNPVWFVKTRMQLDVSKYGSPTAWETVQSIYKTQGVHGFFKGITASYYGISETILHFVVYEFIKTKFHQLNVREADGHRGEVAVMGGSSVPPPAPPSSSEQKLNFLQYMAAAAASKSFASILAYPHEVARTRLREEGHKYSKFFQTLFLVYREEGFRHGLYRGLCTQLLRQVPNTAIMMGTYEVVVYFMKNLYLPQTTSTTNSKSSNPPTTSSSER